jgi:hypothetical protein
VQLEIHRDGNPFRPVGNYRMANPNHRMPHKGDRVSVAGQNGAFIVYGVDASIKAAELRQIGRDLALSSIPWDSLTFLDGQAASQADPPQEKERRLGVLPPEQGKH